MLFAVGEPLNKEAWKWYHNVVGDGRCTIVDTYWQTGTHHPAPVSTVLHTMSPGHAMQYVYIHVLMRDEKEVRTVHMHCVKYHLRLQCTCFNER